MTRGRAPLSAHELRRRAEQQLTARETSETHDTDIDLRRLIHELEVHQIELEMQNEELMEARREVETGLKTYTELFDFAPIGYFVLGADGTIHELNHLAARLLGLERQRLVGRRLHLFISENQRRTFCGFLEQVANMANEGQMSMSCEATLSPPGGGEACDGRFTATLLDRQLTTMLVAMEDVTGLKRAEAALRREGRNKDEFLAILSHELRNPLAPIRNSLYLLSKLESGGDQSRKAQAVIDRQVSHLTRIVDDLLDVTRIGQGKIRLQREPLDLCEIVRRAMDDYRPSFEATGVKLQARLGSEHFRVNADGTRILQVLGNLLSNAVKFTPQGGQLTSSCDERATLWRCRCVTRALGLPPTCSLASSLRSCRLLRHSTAAAVVWASAWPW